MVDLRSGVALCLPVSLWQPQQPGSMPPPPGPYGYGQPAPPTRPPGPPTGLPGPPTGPPTSRPPGPFHLGPPTSAQGPAPGSYQQQPPVSQGMMGPPAGPPAGPTGPLSGPTGPPSGPYGQPHAGSQPGHGYPQPAVGHNAVNSMAGDFSRMGVNVSFAKMRLFPCVRVGSDWLRSIFVVVSHVHMLIHSFSKNLDAEFCSLQLSYRFRHTSPTCTSQGKSVFKDK